MESDTNTRKKAYTPPEVTRHGDVVAKTLGGGHYEIPETFYPGTADWH